MRIISAGLLRLPPGLVENPYQALLSLAAVVAGVANLSFRYQVSPSVLLHVATGPVFVAWGLSLTVGGTLGLLGILVRGTRLSHFAHDIERAGSSLLGFALYGFALVVFVRHAWYTGAMAMIFGTGILLRAVTLGDSMYQEILRRQVEREILKD